MESPAFAEGRRGLLHALDESNVQLLDVVCQVAERTLEVLGPAGADIRTAAAADAATVATLVVRVYEHTRDEAVKTRCLNLIDRMEEWGYYGTGRELAKLDR